MMFVPIVVMFSPLLAGLGMMSFGHFSVGNDIAGWIFAVSAVILLIVAYLIA